MKENAPYRKIRSIFRYGPHPGTVSQQTSLFPLSLEELTPEDHLVRVIDLDVAKLDLARLGFDKALPKRISKKAGRATPSFITKVYRRELIGADDHCYIGQEIEPGAWEITFGV